MMTKTDENQLHSLAKKRSSLGISLKISEGREGMLAVLLCPPGIQRASCSAVAYGNQENQTTRWGSNDDFELVSHHKCYAYIRSAFICQDRASSKSVRLRQQQLNPHCTNQRSLELALFPRHVVDENHDVHSPPFSQ